MGIITVIDFDKTQDLNTIVFGDGRVSVADFSGAIDGDGAFYSGIGFRSLDEPVNVGDMINHDEAGNSFDEYRPEFALMFKNAESIDVLIEALGRAKSSVIEHREE